ncbi:hypothetical protein ACJIZ3_020708 [Penstemon smallii]|uniref:NAD-dependent epimerase/dehydratase domain-containing protein n=1 Tax=Penstemon smallii TaxID=265156 RepID=A0ABD3SJE2_9LAMI
MIESHEKLTVCVLDASTYVGFWILKKLLNRGYKVHAAVRKNGEKEMIKKIEVIKERTESKLTIFMVDMLDYHSILEALKSCSALFCCLDSSDKYDSITVDFEVRGTINAVEACAQTESIRKIVFGSSLTAAVWKQNICSQKNVDERSWSDQEFCKKMKLWYALAKTLSEKAAWALAMDRMLDMVSINAGLVIGPDVAHLNPQITMSYLKGAEQMYENGVLAYVNVNFLADVHIRAFEESSASGRYFCFDRIVNSELESMKLVESLSPLISIPSSYVCEDSETKTERLRNTKLGNLINLRSS